MVRRRPGPAQRNSADAGRDVARGQPPVRRRRRGEHWLLRLPLMRRLRLWLRRPRDRRRPVRHRCSALPRRGAGHGTAGRCLRSRPCVRRRLPNLRSRQGVQAQAQEFQNSTSVFVLFSFSNCVTARLLDDRGLSWRGGSPCGPPASSASSGSPLRAGRRGGNPRRGGGGIGHYSKESIPNWDGRRGGEDRGTNPPTRLTILTSARAFWSCWSALATTSFGASKNSLHLGRSGREDKPQ